MFFFFCPLLCDWALYSLEYFIKYQVCFNVAMSFLPDLGDPIKKFVNMFFRVLVAPSFCLIIPS